MKLYMIMMPAVLMVFNTGCTIKTAPMPEFPKMENLTNCCEALKKIENEFIKPIFILKLNGNCLK